MYFISYSRKCSFNLRFESINAVMKNLFIKAPWLESSLTTAFPTWVSKYSLNGMQMTPFISYRSSSKMESFSSEDKFILIFFLLRICHHAYQKLTTKTKSSPATPRYQCFLISSQSNITVSSVAAADIAAIAAIKCVQ